MLLVILVKGFHISNAAQSICEYIYRISELKYNATHHSLFCELVKGFLQHFQS